ncbi:NAD(P)-binding protein [Polyangium sp. 6x1]|uniref:NAD(P)-binding protein n=1 Tax=Polyangium sp. 6x1 TaxID=3042689 RepID=UPI002482D357|nr:NAD(P)-binding protein [Polyangium sp. 6x1]MDI1451823.1 NAD(P)-binding protein [Polyangium sp. 6x1]
MKQRIVILGGGMAALTTAFELTNRPGFQDRFDITVYQTGWRLGGKGASGVNRAQNDRIEEHGLHVFWGFYENAFRVMREVYAELSRPPGAPLASWTDAFKPHDLVVLPEATDRGWTYQPLRAPRNGGAPGAVTATLEPWQYIPRLLRQVSDLVAGDLLPQLDRWRNEIRSLLPGLRSTVDQAAKADSKDIKPVESLLRSVFERGGLAVLLAGRWAGRVALWFGLDLAEAIASTSRSTKDIENARDAILWIMGRYLAQVVRFSSDEPELRRLRVSMSLFMTVVRGLLVDDLVLPPRNWLSIDHLSFREWLAKHGAEPEAIHSPLIDGLHAAAYAHGLDVAAGTLLHAILRLTYSYQGALLYKMQAGMGETVFAPLFTVLERRGVRFEFFHRVQNLELSADRKHIARIQMARQATVKGDRYRPMVDVRGLPCWPTEPLYEQLVEGQALQQSGVDLEDAWADWAPVEELSLEAGRDFDNVVLAISVGALPHVCDELVRDENNPRFGAMVRGIRTCQTQSAQLWMSRPLGDLGWSGPPPIVIPFASPFDTWADMSHLLSRERWPEEKVASLAYVTARIDDDEPVPPPGLDGYAERQKARVGENLKAWLERSAGGLWPNATRPADRSAFNWGVLQDPEERSGSKRLDAQYWCATRNPSDRYVLAAPGTSALRLRADESGYRNLLLAGDWILTAMNLGCVEAATLGGLQAAQALDPGVRAGIGDWLTQKKAPLPAPVPLPPPAPVASPARRDLPRFIMRDGDLMATPPVGLRISVYNFVLEASFERLTALCNAHLNIDGTTRYRPLAPFVILYASAVDNYPIPEPIGWVPETDFGIWVPLLAGEERKGTFHVNRVVFYTPYIWVSNDVALLNGRLYFGFKKDIGVMQMPASPERADRFSLDAWVLPRHDPAQSIEHRRILDVERVDGGPQDASWEQVRAFLDQSQQGIGLALRSLEGLRRARSDGWGLGLDFASQLGRDVRRGMRKVFLKQMPDVVDGRKACYQAIVEAEVAVTGNLRTRPLPGRWSCQMTRYASHRIADTLGLVADRREGDVSFHTPLLAGWASFDAQVGGGEIIREIR